MNLGFLPLGTIPGPEEYNDVDSAIDGMLEELQWRNVVFVPDGGTLGDNSSGQFEDKHFASLAAILADMIKSHYGLAGDPGLAQEAQKAEADLYMIEAQPYTRKILETQFF
jgi:hypothetical protein